jgi:signal transduction histidine kinase
MYLHYPITLEQAKENLGRVRSKWQKAERMHKMKIEQGKWQRRVPVSLQRETRKLYQECCDLERQADTLEEVIAWYEDRLSVIVAYAEQGFVLAYRANNQEFETYEEALSEADFVHQMNDLLLEYGGDGDGYDDLVDAEDMVQAIFVKED